MATVAAAAHFQTVSFGAIADATTARLFLFPVSFQRALGSRVAVDGYAAFGTGHVKADSQLFELRGAVDSWLRLRWIANRATVVAVGLALPTGVERHTSEQSVVASVLSNDLLGFREATWGSGGSATFGVSTARQAGTWRFTSGASYKLTRQFAPSADTSVQYSPGDEAKVRIGIERSLRTGAMFAGVTAQHLGVDQADARNLFRPGARVRGDLSFTGPTWSLSFTNLWRANGDLTLPIINLLDGAFIRDTAFVVGSQNLAIVAASRTVALGSSLLLVPNGEFKIRTRAERVGRGWVGAAGLALPFSAMGAEFFPSAKVSMGELVHAKNPLLSEAMWGAEFSFVIRHSRLRARSPGSPTSPRP